MSDTDNYDDDGGGVAAAAEPAAAGKESEEGAPDTLLPKSFFGGEELKPGMRCEVEIVRVMPDQVMVKKVAESEYAGKEAGGGAQDETAAMMD
jgi:hypothetical protein